MLHHQKQDTRGKEIRTITKDEAKQYGGLRRKHDGPMILQKDLELKNSVFMIERECFVIFLMRCDMRRVWKGETFVVFSVWSDYS